MMRRGLQVGDRVRVACSIEWLPAGTCGTIERVYISAKMYDVRFDGRAAPRTAPADWLEPADEPPRQNTQ